MLATTGVLLAVLWDSVGAVMAGFGLVGAGFATVVPLVFTVAGALCFRSLDNTSSRLAWEPIYRSLCDSSILNFVSRSDLLGN
jgi:hypothetical protein